jgi:NTE family protein
VTGVPAAPVPAGVPASPVAPALRRGFVFGGGGVLGYAWMIGALSAVEEMTGVDVVGSQIVVGTSAGSVLAALASCGISTAELCRHHQGRPQPGDLELDWDYDNITGGALPPRPSLRPGSPRLLLDAMRHPRRVGPLLALSAALPTGRGSLMPIRDAIVSVIAVSGVRQSGPDPADRPTPWLIATDYRTGERVVFGRDVSADLPSAVVASCAIPAWYAPVTIDGRRYIDGGAVSNTSCDVLVDEKLDEVYVLAPAASLHDVDEGTTRAERVERWIRRAVTRAVRREIQSLLDRGTRVIVVTPTSEDLALIGVNLMNPLRRMEVLDTARRTALPQLRTQLALQR